VPSNADHRDACLLSMDKKEQIFREQVLVKG
jgi:hypothetical protein